MALLFWVRLINLCFTFKKKKSMRKIFNRQFIPISIIFYVICLIIKNIFVVNTDSAINIFPVIILFACILSIKFNHKVLFEQITKNLFWHAFLTYCSCITPLLFFNFNTILQPAKIIAYSMLIMTIFFVFYIGLQYIGDQKKKTHKPIQYIALILLVAWIIVTLVSSLLDLAIYLFFNHHITPNLLFVVFETNFRETKEFVSFYMNNKIFIIPLIIVLPFAGKVILKKFDTVRNYTHKIYFWFAIISLFLGSWLSSRSVQPGYNSVSAFIHSIWLYQDELSAYADIKKELKGTVIPDSITSQSPTDSNLAVLIIGESINRNHMGIYGYYRDTTPRLEELSDTLCVFTDVISPHSHTNPAFKKMLTFMNNESSKPWHEYPTLIACFNAAGYKTYWISNQEMYGIYGNLPAALASQASVVIYNKPRT
ncbi:MAG: sulfatase-like hydrolase/transferase, partial [Elusimicrobia bacterium]|nr:sulfatase-like hydrolase/transferase [Elusimicrobiota bacterium]